ncbi:hypothetical protein X772_35920 [Mesorhizobium sp. LSJC280B00]|nr:hypothetical protein X772_35920 [Mesorhizobium sp. LSJC280B00]
MGQGRGLIALQPTRLGKIDAEAITPALYFGRGVATLFLNIALVDLG